MARNVEIKARIADLGDLRARIEALGAIRSETLYQRDTFFTVPHGRLKLREFANGAGELIAYERPDTPGPKVSTYHRVPVSEPAALREVLTSSLGIRAVVTKRREVFLLGQTRIHLDEVESLGSFIEFEVVLQGEQDLEGGQRIVAMLLEHLGILPADLLSGAYVDLIEQTGRAERC